MTDCGGIARGAYMIEVTTFGLVGETTTRIFLYKAVPRSGLPLRGRLTRKKQLLCQATLA